MSEKATQSTPTMRLPVAAGVVRHRQSRQAEGGPVRKGACQPGPESRNPVAAPSSGGQRPKDRRDCRSAAGWPSSCDRPHVRAVHSPRPLRQAARSRCERKRPSYKPAERVLRGVWFNPWRLGAPLAAKLARDRRRRSGRRKPGVVEDGWYEAIVVEANGDMFTLRWRDYPRERRIVRHRLRLGLLYPEPRPTAEKGNQRKPRATQSTTNRSRQIPPPTANRCPKIGTRSISIISCWPKTTANGGRGGKPSRSRKPVTSSSSAGARNMRPTSR